MILKIVNYLFQSSWSSILKQNFNENAGILVMVGTYYLLHKVDVSVNGAVIIFGLFVSTIMLFIMNWHRCNVTRHGEEIEKLLDVARSSSHP